MRVDIPFEKTEEQLKKDGLSSKIYKAQLEALQDPKRGLFEKPEVGVKGHHEFMLTTDICLAYAKNDNLRNCYNNYRSQHRDNDNRGITGIVNVL